MGAIATVNEIAFGGDCEFGQAACAAPSAIRRGVVPIPTEHSPVAQANGSVAR